MSKLNPTKINDIQITNTGDLLIGYDGDIATVSDAAAINQNVLFRLKTVVGDFILEPECGASLESVIGSPNSEETGNIIEALVLRALTHDNFLSQEQLKITTFPVDNNTIMLITQIQIDEDISQIVTSLDLREGQIQIIL